MPHRQAVDRRLGAQLTPVAPPQQVGDCDGTLALRRGIHAVRATPQINVIDVQFQDLVLGEGALELPGDLLIPAAALRAFADRMVASRPRLFGPGGLGVRAGGGRPNDLHVAARTVVRVVDMRISFGCGADHGRRSGRRALPPRRSPEL